MRASAWCLTVFGLLVGREASAAKPPVIALDMAGCPAEESELRRLIGIELEAEVIGPASPTSDLSSVGVTCDGDLYRLTVVSRSDPTKTRTRELDLGATGAKARPRFLALAIVELITTRPPEPRPVATRDDTTAVVTVAAPPAPAPAPVHASVMLLGRFLPSNDAASFGGGLRLERGFGTRGVGLLDLLGERATRDVGAGDIQATGFSLGATFGLRGQAGPLGGRISGGGRVGFAEVQGRASGVEPGSVRSSSFVAPWAGPILSVGGSLDVVRSVRIDVGAEAGWAAAAVSGRVNGRDPVGFRGPWVALLLGFALRL